MSDRHALQRIAREQGQEEKLRSLWDARAQKVLDGCHEPQRKMILDGKKMKAGRCPRRSGKSHGGTSYALYIGEKFPKSRVLIIGLTLKAAKENYWRDAPGGLQSLSSRFGLGVDFNYQDSSWRHENGSIGYLAGGETAADLERLRGSKVEVDLVIVDECKSFSPLILKTLIQDVLVPGLMTRDGTLLLIGTPGSIPLGDFYEATCESHRIKYMNEDGVEVEKPTCIPYHARDAYREAFKLNAEEQEDLWSLHVWTLQDNVARPGQWVRALREKRRAKWDDNHPTWRREFLGEWSILTLDLVYHQYLGNLSDGRVNWTPDPDTAYGLPKDGGPWHFLIGLDWGYEDPTAFAVVAYGEHDPNMYVVDQFKCEHMLYSEVKATLTTFMKIYSPVEMIVYDRADKQMGESLSGDGFPAVPADKHEKFAFIELLNSDMATGKFKVLKDSPLHFEYTALQFDLSKGDKATLARLGKLKEDPACSNHLADAALYVWRWSNHGAWTKKQDEPEKGTQEWWDKRVREQKELAEKAFIDRKNGMNERLMRHGKLDHLLNVRLN